MMFSVPELFASVGSSSACWKMNQHEFGVALCHGLFLLVMKDLFT